MKIIVSIWIIIAISCAPSAAVSQPPAPGKETGQAAVNDLGITVRDGRIFMDVRDVEITRILKEMAQKAGIDMSIGDGVEGRVTLKMGGVPLEDAIRRLCENRALVFEYLPQKKTYRIIRVGTYSGKAGKEVKVLKTLIAKDLTPPSETGSRRTAGAVRRGVERRYDSKGRLLYRPGELLIRFKTGVSTKQLGDLHQALGSKVVGRMTRIRLQRIKLKEGLSEQEAIDRYAASGLVEVAERHALRYPNSIVPNDTHFSEQWGMAKIKAPEAWEITKGDSGLIIAVIDTGVDYLHPDLNDNIWINTAELNGTEGVDDDGNGYVDDIYGWDFAGNDEYDLNDQDSDPMDMDSYGHGTHVTGTIAARGDNGMGVTGVNWRAKIMVLKVMAENASAMDEYDVIQAIDYARDNGARIVNCSFGGETYDDIEYDAFADLKQAGILAVCAAGNNYWQNTDQNGNYPSSYSLDNIISVAASNRSDALADFSNYGPTSVDVMAPGVEIKSTTPFKTEASLYTGSTTYIAFSMEFAGLTDEDGISRAVYDCGQGYQQDFPDEVNGNIALIKRGNKDGIDFYFYEKTANAMDAGAIAAIIYNNEAGDFDNWTLLSPGNWIPVICISKEDGESMTPPVTVTLVNKIGQAYSYDLMGGTSMATPHVAGVAGLLLSVNPGLGYAGVKSAVLDTVDKIASVSDKMVSGGRINARSALSEAYERGDVTGDNTVGLDDAVVALQVLSGMIPDIGSSCISCGVDVDGDDDVGLAEAIYIFQKVSELREGETSGG